ncbi:MAG: NAD-dependent dehydratase [Planctomycetes bacterium]|nr:NAD-dependent dehydratase [Planctomycetota bacterium]
MQLENRTILITGADGFIGSHLTEELVRRGHRVRAMVWYNAFGREGWLDDTSGELRDGMEIVPGDVRDAHSVRNAMHGVDVVLHLAALIGIPYSYRAPQSYVDTNVTGTLNVLQAARELGVSRVVHTSTSEVYGTAQTVPITEDHPLVGQSPYAATKIGADQMALSFYKSFGTPVTVLRPFNTYGPRQSARAVIPTVITQLIAGHDVIHLGATDPTRDLTFVDDTVAAFIAAATSPTAVGRTIHVGTGHEITIGDLAHTIAEVMGRTITLETDPARIRPEGSEVERLLCDPTRARKLLDWAPRNAGRDGLIAGLRETVAWFQARQTDLVGYRAETYCV